MLRAPPPRRIAGAATVTTNCQLATGNWQRATATATASLLLSIWWLGKRIYGSWTNSYDDSNKQPAADLGHPARKITARRQFAPLYGRVVNHEMQIRNAHTIKQSFSRSKLRARLFICLEHVKYVNTQAVALSSRAS